MDTALSCSLWEAADLEGGITPLHSCSRVALNEDGKSQAMLCWAEAHTKSRCKEQQAALLSWLNHQVRQEWLYSTSSYLCCGGVRQKTVSLSLKWLSQNRICTPKTVHEWRASELIRDAEGIRKVRTICRINTLKRVNQNSLMYDGSVPMSIITQDFRRVTWKKWLKRDSPRDCSSQCTSDVSRLNFSIWANQWPGHLLKLGTLKYILTSSYQIFSWEV